MADELNIGTRVHYRGDPQDTGTVIAVLNESYWVKWDSGSSDGRERNDLVIIEE